MEELVNENQPAPKVEKISLAELKAETAKMNEEENKHIQEQKELEEKLKQKKKQEEEQFNKEFDIFLRSFNTFSPEEQKKIMENLQ